MSRKTRSLIDPAAEVVDQISKWNLPVGDADIFLTSGEAGKNDASSSERIRR